MVADTLSWKSREKVLALVPNALPRGNARRRVNVYGSYVDSAYDSGWNQESTRKRSTELKANVNRREAPCFFVLRDGVLRYEHGDEKLRREIMEEDHQSLYMVHSRNTKMFGIWNRALLIEHNKVRNGLVLLIEHSSTVTITNTSIYGAL